MRRVLTAINAQGRSFIAEDDPSPARLTSANRPGYCNAKLWRTAGAPAAVLAPDDITQHSGVLPPAGATLLRVIDFPPQPSDPQEQRRQHAAVFATMFQDARHAGDSPRHPGMHGPTAARPWRAWPSS